MCEKLPGGDGRNGCQFRTVLVVLLERLLQYFWCKYFRPRQQQYNKNEK